MLKNSFVRTFGTGNHLVGCAHFASLSHFCATPDLPGLPRQVHHQLIMGLQSASSSSTPKLQGSRKPCFGTTHVIQPKGEHRATIVWLHGRGDEGASWAEELKDLPVQNIKWIVPTAPVVVMDGFPCNAWFDARPFSEEEPKHLEGLDASAAHIAALLSQESSNVKLGVGGFSQGAATSFYTTVCSMLGSYSDGTDFPCKFDITVGLSGWLPSAKALRSGCEKSKALEQARGYPIFLGHGTSDHLVLYKQGEEAAATLQSLGFNSLVFKTYKWLGHSINPIEMKDVCGFLKEKLHLRA